jgi:hypothetical protein
MMNADQIHRRKTCETGNQRIQHDWMLLSVMMAPSKTADGSEREHLM